MYSVFANILLYLNGIVILVVNGFHWLTLLVDG